MTPSIRFDPTSWEQRVDPYPIYQAMRERDPIHCWEPEGGRYWCLTRYQDVVAVLRDDRFSAARLPSEATAAGVPDRFRRFGELLSHMMLIQDPPDHGRLRGLVGRAFTPRVVEALRPRIEAIVDGLLGAVITRGQGRMDVIRDLATPLPVLVIAELLGVPGRDQWKFKQWSDDIAVVLDGTLAPEGFPRAIDSANQLADYLREVVAERRRTPRNDLLSGLVSARDREDALSEDELIANAILLLLAGHETTTNLLGNGTLALLRHPEQLLRLRRQPGLARSAVEELLRFDSPVQLTSRLPRHDLEFGGVRFEAGLEVDLLLGAANRDPAVFPAPEVLDLSRAENRHLAFGVGPHFCLGAPLARLEGQVTFQRLARRLPELKLDVEEPERRPGFVLRGLASLPVRF